MLRGLNADRFMQTFLELLEFFSASILLDIAVGRENASAVRSGLHRTRLGCVQSEALKWAGSLHHRSLC
jgi:hypothetical protein